MSLQKTLDTMKEKMEYSIISTGAKGKESLIRSKSFINLLHEAVKEELISNGVKANQIFPPLGKTKPELKIAGVLKKKDQDICVVPEDIQQQKRIITWGPLQFEEEHDKYGQNFVDKTIIINIRSQMSSVAKNTDTLFERTFAEALNLHTIYPNAVLGEVYLIPVYEYSQKKAKDNIVDFKSKKTNLEKYVSFFTALNNRTSSEDDLYKYEKCALIIADFSQNPCKIYTSTKQLKEDKLVSEKFSLELHDISFEVFTKDILKTYKKRFKVK